MRKPKAPISSPENEEQFMAKPSSGGIEIPEEISEETPELRPGSKEDANQNKEEIGGPSGPEPTRYGDWEVGGRCTDF